MERLVDFKMGITTVEYSSNALKISAKLNNKDNLEMKRKKKIPIAPRFLRLIEN